MLPELQKQFMDGMLRDDIQIHKQLDPKIRDSQLQINIYRNSYQGGLLKAMKDIYPVTARLLGDKFFDAMCLRYIKQTPCQFFDINHYSESFSEFAMQFKPVSELVYLPDVIRLEWAWHNAYQADDIIQQDFSPLLSYTELQLESVYLKLAASMTLLTSPYPVDLIWTANQTDEQGEQENIEIGSEPCYLLIWRNGLNSHIDVIELALFKFLTSIQSNQNLGQLQKNDSNFEEQLVTSLQRGYFSAFHFKG